MDKMTELEKEAELALIADLITGREKLQDSLRVVRNLLEQSQAAQYLQTVEPGLVVDIKV